MEQPAPTMKRMVGMAWNHVCTCVCTLLPVASTALPSPIKISKRMKHHKAKQIMPRQALHQNLKPKAYISYI